MKKELVITIVIAVASAGMSFGVCQNQISNNTQDIERLELTHQKDVDAINSRQNQTDTLLQSINNNLASLNTKMDLLVEGKINSGRCNND